MQNWFQCESFVVSVFLVLGGDTSVFFCFCFSFSFCLLLVTWHSVLIFVLFCFCFLPLRCPACCVSWHFYHQPLHGPPASSRFSDRTVAIWKPRTSQDPSDSSDVNDDRLSVSSQWSGKCGCRGRRFALPHSGRCLDVWSNLVNISQMTDQAFLILLFLYPIWQRDHLSLGGHFFLFFFWESWEKGQPRNTASFLDPHLPRRNVFPGCAVPGKRPFQWPHWLKALFFSFSGPIQWEPPHPPTTHPPTTRPTSLNPIL